MPRQRGGAAPRRPTPPAPKPAAPAPQRHSSTAAHPPQQQQHAPTQQAPPQQGSQGPGLFGQMASTAAGVAVGSSIGHAVGGWFSGGGSQPAEQQGANQDFAQQHQQANYENQSGTCQAQIGDFRRCMDENQGSLNICGWYLDQLKACQSAASQY